MSRNFFLNFDYKNEYKNELEDNKEKSCSWSRKRVSHKIDFKAVWPRNVHAASVGVKIWKQCLPCSENFCFRPLELDSINKINKNIFSFPIRHSILFNLWILKSHDVFSKKNTNCVLYFQGSANFWEIFFGTLFGSLAPPWSKDRNIWITFGGRSIGPKIQNQTFSRVNRKGSKLNCFQF